MALHPPRNDIYGDVDGVHYDSEGADGFYLMLKPLSRGCHTIHFHANVPPWNLDLDVTYDLTVG